MATLTPSAVSVCRTSAVRPGSRISAVSVISSTRSEQASSARASARWTTSISPGSSNWRAETLTDTLIGCPLGTPARGLQAGLLDHPGADLHDQPALLGERDELGRRDEPAR